jgi:hypothetical protein
MHKDLKINLYRGLIEDKEKLYFKIQNMKAFIILEGTNSEMLQEYMERKHKFLCTKKKYKDRMYDLYPIYLWDFLREITFDSSMSGFFEFKSKKVKFHIVQTSNWDESKNWYIAIY